MPLLLTLLLLLFIITHFNVSHFHSFVTIHRYSDDLRELWSNTKFDHVKTYPQILEFYHTIYPHGDENRLCSIYHRATLLRNGKTKYQTTNNTHHNTNTTNPEFNTTDIIQKSDMQLWCLQLDDFDNEVNSVMSDEKCNDEVNLGSVKKRSGGDKRSGKKVVEEKKKEPRIRVSKVITDM